MAGKTSQEIKGFVSNSRPCDTEVVHRVGTWRVPSLSHEVLVYSSA